jgi:SAM-dependent methyltransferase
VTGTARGSRRAIGPPAGSVERLPIDVRLPWWGEHRSRYRFAAAQLDGGVVLDIACGTGFGTEMLSADVAMVVGSDVFLPALASSRIRMRGTPAAFVAADGTRLPFASGSFHGVVSMETIEHIPNDGAFLDELRRVLRRGGRLVLSTPNATVTRRYPRNPFHVREYTPSELLAKLRPAFREVLLYGQNVSSPYRIAPFLPARDSAERPGDQLRLVAWKLCNRLPFTVKNTLSRMLLRRDFYPGETDYAFTDDFQRAHVLVAVCLK